MMRSKRALAILTSLVLAFGTLSVGTFAADNSASAPTESPAEAVEDACANGHDYVLKKEIAPTCTEDGYREEVCSRCGDTRRVDGEKALGHDFSGEGRVTREATADREGELTFTCLRDDCNETKIEKIPKLEKTAEDTDAAPASSNQNQQDQNQADQTSQQESAAQNAGQTQKGEAAQNATLSIAGIPVPQEKGTIKAGESKIKFKREGEGNQEEITLTFDDSTLEVNGSSKKQPPEAVIAYTGTGTLNISIDGENAVTGKNSSYGVYAPDGTVKLTGKKGATLDIQAASENSNTIRAKKIVVDDSLEIAGPENNYIYEGNNGMGGTYQTIAVANNGRNMAVSKVTIQDPAAAENKKDAEEKEEEEKEGVEKTDETADAERINAVQNDADQDKTDDKNDQKDETVTEDKEANNTEGTQKQENTEDTEAEKDDQQAEDENKTEEEPAQNTPSSTRKKLSTAPGLLGAPSDDENTSNSTGEGNNQSDSVTTTDLRIDGKEMTDASGPVTAGEGTIEYKVSANSETGKNDVEITLNKAELISAAEAAISYMGDGTLTIILKGENKLTGTDHAIYAPFADVTITGDKEDSLIATSTELAAVIGKNIVVNNPLEVVEPAENRYAEIDIVVDGKNAPVKNIAEGKEEGNGALSVIIRVPAEYTITFDKNGGDGEMADVPYKENAGDYKLPKCEFTAPENQEFDQWEVDGNPHAVGEEIPVTGNITVKALWKDIVYTVHFDAGEGTDDGSMPDQTVTKKDSKILLPDCTFTPQTGKVFDKWEVNDGEYAAGKTAPITADTTIKALWKDPEKATYKVTYDANGGSGTMAPDTIVEGKELTLPACDFTPPTGMSFDKWEVNNGKYDVGKKAPIIKDTSVKAIWKAGEVQHQHTKKEIKGEEATCTKDGVIKHYKCDVCGKLFSDEAMTKEISESDTVIKAGHTWDMRQDKIAAKMSSDGSQITYTFKCLNCDETKAVTVDLTEDNTKLPTKNKDGSLYFETSLDGKKASSTVKVSPAGTKGYSFTVPQKRNAAVWVKNSKDSLGFTIKRSEYDTITYPEYQNGGSILVDKKKVDSKNYTVEKGSLKITFKPSYLNTLSAGTHTLHVNFGDGSVEEKFTVNASSATGNGTAARTTNATTNRTANATTNRTANGSPRTGDTSKWALWIGLIAVSVIAIAAIVFVRKRGKKNEAAAATAEADKKADETGNGGEQG